jgi:hypothetical protein
LYVVQKRLPKADNDRSMSRLTPLLMAIALVVGIAGWRSPTPPDAPRATIKAVDGTLSLSNSLDGSALLQVANMAPGDTAGGVVALANTGTLGGALDLSQADLTDSLGPGGGQLSLALQLTVRDAVSGDVVYSGPLAGLNRRPLGGMAPGERRTYSFNVSMPDTGAPPSPLGGDNAFAGAAVGVRYRWELTGDNGGGGGGGGAGGGGGGGVTGMPVSVKVSARRALTKGIVEVTVKCGEPCRVRAYAALRKRAKLKTRRKSAMARVANKRVKINLRHAKKVRGSLRKRLAAKGKDYVVVYVRATDPRGGVVNLKKQVRVTRKRR